MLTFIFFLCHPLDGGVGALTLKSNVAWFSSTGNGQGSIGTLQVWVGQPNKNTRQVININMLALISRNLHLNLTHNLGDVIVCSRSQKVLEGTELRSI